ncbi:MAG TPA: phosphopantetheine-binding protein [Mycobacterium sp.]|nr:phosphopantetheine-binding protein [Mycobacterium sp.]
MEAAISAPGAGSLLGEHIGVSTTPPVHLWQALLNAEVKPYPGCHRIRGADVIPASVLLQTLSTAAAECGASALSDVRFEDPIVLDEPRVIQVVADGESVTVLSAFAADAPAHRWIRHAGARISHRTPDQPADAQQVLGDDTAAVDLASLQQACGIEGQAFRWSIDSCRLGPDGLRADVDVPEPSTVALLDIAIQLARLVDDSEQRLMVPAAAESVRIQAGHADQQACIEVHRRNDNGDGLLVDIAVKTPDGGTCVDIRSLRYADMDSAAAPAGADADEPPAKWDWAQVAAEDIPGELVARLRAMVARELGIPADAVDVDLTFPELGLDSIMATSILRQGRQSLGIDLSSTMFWDHPTISSLVTHLVELLAPQQVPQAGAEADEPADSTAGVLDELFDNVESASAGGGRGTF